MERIEEYTAKVGSSRNAAIHDLIEAGLEADRWSGRKPGLTTISEVVAADVHPAVKAEAAVRARKLPIVRGSDPKLDVSSVPVAGGRMAEVRRDTGAGGWFLPKGKK
jgi:hypothetical protein